MRFQESFYDGRSSSFNCKKRFLLLDHHADYQSKISSLVTYKNIYREISSAIAGADILVDIGNGGVFDYDVTQVKRITAVDLMFTPGFKASIPKNSETVLGSALDLPLQDGSADIALMNMLLHHLTGKDVQSTLINLHKCVTEAARIVKPGGKLVLMESCVPKWFFSFEKVVYKLSLKVIERITEHPPTLQFPATVVEAVLRDHFIDVAVRPVPKGAWVLQYGKHWPSALTPVQPYLFTAVKS